jgi:hypothetical protein
VNPWGIQLRDRYHQRTGWQAIVYHTKIAKEVVEHLRLMRELGRLHRRLITGYRMGVAAALLLAAVGLMMMLRLLIL